MPVHTAAKPHEIRQYAVSIVVTYAGIGVMLGKTARYLVGIPVQEARITVALVRHIVALAHL